jgi:hypothetical protein
MTKKSKFPLPKLAPELLRGRRISDPIDHEAAESVEAIAKIAGAGASCVPACYSGGRVGFKRSKKLKGLKGLASCAGKTVTLWLCELTLGEAVSMLETLISMRSHRRGKR